MTGRTFTTSLTERRRRRIGGPALTLIVGAGGDSRTSTGEDRPAHPAQEGFIPDGVPSDARDDAVPDSGPGSPPIRATSRGSASPDGAGVVATGSGPKSDGGPSLARIADVVEADAGDGVAAADDRIRSIR